ncbi:hypothetical protein OG349_21640 [Streptomyces sp. NBC_01317]|uniref:hypothetical protein n=1 Tax=Streptomyces sp. NBC_01317 TaxID=2903822 RepID=UPI002E115BC4|nr:hypothetical protein OG349_21640 [Streptomyces sp. NBC_01317]
MADDGTAHVPDREVLDQLFELEIRRICRAAVVDRFPMGTRPPQAGLLFGPEWSVHE